MEYLTDDYYRRRTRSVVTQINQVNRLSAYVIDSDEETGQPRIVPRSPPRPIEILSDSEHPSSNSPQNRPARLLVCRDDSSTEMSLSVGTSSQSDCTDIEELTPRRSATKNQEVHQILATLTSLSSSTIYPKYLSDRFQSLQTFQNLFPIYHTLHLTPQSTTACPADCLLRQFPLLASNQYQLIHRVWHCGLPSYLELGADWEWAWRYIIRGTRQKKEMITTEACRIQQLLQAKGQLDCDEIEAYQTAWMEKYQPNVDLMNNERTVYNLHQQRLQDEEEDRIDFIFPRRNNSRPKKRCFRLERCHTKHSSEIGAKQGLRFEHELDNRFRRPKLQFSEDFRESPMSSIHPSESALDSPPSEDAPPIQKPPHPPSQKEEHSETDLFETQISQNEQKFQVQPVKSLFSSVSASDQPSFHESQQSSQPLLPSALLENHQRSETPLTLLQNRFGVQFEETFAGLPETPEYDSMVRPNEEIGKEDESASDEQLSDIIISLSETPQNPEHHSIAHVSLHDSQTQLSSQPSPPSLETFTPSDNIIITSEQQPLPPSNSFGTLSLTAHSEDLQTQPVVPETNFIVDERSLSQLEYASQDSGNPSPEQLPPLNPVVPSASVHIPFNHIQQSFGGTHAELLRDICEWDPNSEQIVEVTMPDRTPLNNPSDGAGATHIVQRTSSDPIVENADRHTVARMEWERVDWKEDPTQQNEANFEKSVGLPLSIPTSVEFVERISEWLAREDAKAKSELARTVDDILITPTEEEPPNSLLQLPLLSSFFPALPPKPTPPDYTPLSSLQISPNVSVIAIISDFTLPRPPINKSHPPSKPRGHGAPLPNGGDWHVKLSLVDETLPVNMNGLVTPITANLFFSWNQMRDPACPCHNLRVGAVVWLKSITVQKYQGRPQIKGSSGFFSMEIFSRTDEQLLKVVFDSKKTLDVGVEEEQARKEDKQEIIDCDADTPKIILSRRRKGKKGAKRFAWRKKTDGKAEPDSPSPSKTVRDVPREEEEDEEIMLKDADENEKTVTRSNPTEDPDTWDESQRISSPKPPPNQPPTPSSPTEHFSPPPFALVSPPTFLRRQHNPFIPTPLHSTPSDLQTEHTRQTRSSTPSPTPSNQNAEFLSRKMQRWWPSISSCHTSIPSLPTHQNRTSHR
ncbi:hypothetical protein BLNAU_22510 [Blattamonas nauphoetae]|uniref:Uncharacterized protein n=1 Tax=Blattamonas nauphoetae TaxID=2049346 RepID=A0ABQ9WTC2_9EUKA|nr:hypothetical protein BLNAU_22510 [Blattamonas nauphoetae]